MCDELCNALFEFAPFRYCVWCILLLIAPLALNDYGAASRSLDLVESWTEAAAWEEKECTVIASGRRSVGQCRLDAFHSRECPSEYQGQPVPRETCVQAEDRAFETVGRLRRLSPHCDYEPWALVEVRGRNEPFGFAGEVRCAYAYGAAAASNFSNSTEASFLVSRWNGTSAALPCSVRSDGDTGVPYCGVALGNLAHLAEDAKVEAAERRGKAFLLFLGLLAFGCCGWASECPAGTFSLSGCKGAFASCRPPAPRSSRAAE